MFLQKKQSYIIQGKCSHSKSTSVWSFSTRQAYSPGWASGCPCWNETLALLHLVSPLASCKAWKVLVHQAESPPPILIHCTDRSDVTGSLAKIPGSKERQAKRVTKTGGRVNTALKNGHCHNSAMHQIFLRTFGMYQGTIWQETENLNVVFDSSSPTLLSLWREILSPTLSQKNGTHDSGNRNCKCKLLKPF